MLTRMMEFAESIMRLFFSIGSSLFDIDAD